MIDIRLKNRPFYVETVGNDIRTVLNKHGLCMCEVFVWGVLIWWSWVNSPKKKKTARPRLPWWCRTLIHTYTLWYEQTRANEIRNITNGLQTSYIKHTENRIQKFKYCSARIDDNSLHNSICI